MLWAARASAAVVTVLSSNAAPYLEAQAGIEATLATSGQSVRSVQLAELSRNNSIKPGDTVVAVGSEAAAWARDNAPGNDPLYFCLVPNAHVAGLQTAKRACRGVVTDVPLSVQIDLIAQTLPAARSIGMLYRSDLEQGRQAKAELESALPQGWTLQAVAVNEFDSKSKAIDALLDRGIDIVWTSPDPNVYDISVLKALLLASLRKSVPVYGFSQAIVKSGGIVGTNINPHREGRAVAELLVDDLKSGKPRETLASETRPPRHEVIVNAIVASKLNITIPKPVLTSASHVYANN